MPYCGHVGRRGDADGDQRRRTGCLDAGGEGDAERNSFQMPVNCRSRRDKDSGGEGGRQDEAPEDAESSRRLDEAAS